MDPCTEIADAEQERGECVYCGRVGIVTRDHIPPKNLFSKPRPDNLITVPSCVPCNKGCERDDEYFRLMLIMRVDVGSHPEYDNLWPVVYRSLERRRDHGLTIGLLKNVNLSEMRSPSGLYYQLPTYNVSLERLDRVAKRITTGLFYHEFRRRLPDGYSAVAYGDSGFTSSLASEEATRSLCSNLLVNPPTTIGANVFSYWIKGANDNPNTTACLLEFFGSVRFLCLTLPDELARKRGYTDEPCRYVYYPFKQ